MHPCQEREGNLRVVPISLLFQSDRVWGQLDENADGNSQENLADHAN
jgi:hypothetical protein